MSSPEIILGVLILLAGAVIFVTFRLAYGCGYRQGACDSARKVAAFQRLKSIERSNYEHGKN